MMPLHLQEPFIHTVYIYLAICILPTTSNCLVSVGRLTVVKSRGYGVESNQNQIILHSLVWSSSSSLELMYQSNRSFNIPAPPWAYPGHLTPFVVREGGNLIACLDVMLRDKSWRRWRRRQTLMNSKEKIAYLCRIG